jgi:hypothetical protein
VCQSRGFCNLDILGNSDERLLIADEADGGVMIVFMNEKNCQVHDVQFGTHALTR